MGSTEEQDGSGPEPSAPVSFRRPIPHNECRSQMLTLLFRSQELGEVTPKAVLSVSRASPIKELTKILNSPTPASSSASKGKGLSRSLLFPPPAPALDPSRPPAASSSNLASRLARRFFSNAPPPFEDLASSDKDVAVSEIISVPHLTGYEHQLTLISDFAVDPCRAHYGSGSQHTRSLSLL